MSFSASVNLGTVGNSITGQTVSISGCTDSSCTNCTSLVTGQQVNSFPKIITGIPDNTITLFVKVDGGNCEGTTQCITISGKPTPNLECGTPIITNVTRSGLNNVIVSFTSGNGCSTTHFEYSLDNVNWSYGNSDSCISPKTITILPNNQSNVYVRMRLTCVGGDYTEYSNTFTLNAVEPTPTPTPTSTTSCEFGVNVILSTPTPTPTPIPSCGAPTITNVTRNGVNDVDVSFTSPGGCVATHIEYSLDNVNWGPQSSSGCSSPRTIKISPNNQGTVYVRMRQTCESVSYSEYSNVFTLSAAVTPTPTPTATPTPTPKPPTPTPTGGGGGCFIENTNILMSDGTIKPIEELMVGDNLMSFNIDGLPLYYDDETTLNTWSTSNLIGTQSNAIITSIIPNYTNQIIIINDLLKTTPNHRHLIKRDGVWSFTEAKMVMVGDVMYDINNNEVDVVSVTSDNNYYRIYEMDVENLDVFYAEGILTHNYKQPTDPIT